MPHALSGVGVLDAGGAGVYDVWNGPTAAQPIPPSTGIALSCVSSSAADSAAGAGVQEITLRYVSTAGLRKTYIFETNGLTPVAMPIDLMFAQCAHTSRIGTDYGAAVGNISFYNGATVYKYLKAGTNRCRSSMRMVPKGFIARLRGGSLAATGTGRVRGFLYATSLDGALYDKVFLDQATIQVQDGSAVVPVEPFIEFPEYTIIKVVADCEKAAFVTANWRAALIGKPGLKD